MSHVIAREFVKKVLLAASKDEVDRLLDALYEESVSFYHLADLIYHEISRQVELGMYLAEKGYGPRDDWRSELEREGFDPIGSLGLKSLSIARKTKGHKKIWDEVRKALHDERVAGKVEKELSEWASEKLSDIIKTVHEEVANARG